MFAGLALCISFCIIGIIYFVLDQIGGETARERARFHERLYRLHHSPKVQIEKASQFSSIKKVNDALIRSKFARNISYLLQMSGWKINPSVYILLSLLAAVSVYHVMRGNGVPPLYSLLLAFVSFYYLPISILKWKRDIYIKKFLGNFPKSIQVIRGALIAGLGLNTSFEHTARDSSYPVDHEFSHMLRQMALGKSLGDALAELRNRIPSKDVNTFCTAIEVQQESGGNLAEVMQNIEETINSRVMIRKEMGALTGQARLTGWIIGLLPIFIGLAINTMNPEYMGLLFDTDQGKKILTGTLILYSIGIICIKKIVSIKIVT